MTHIKILDRCYTTCEREADPDDRWSREETSSTHDIVGFCVADKYGDLEVDFVPNEDDTYYLLAVTYSTGDSFNRHDGAIEFVHLYKDENVAYENMRRIQKHHDVYQQLNGNRWSPFQLPKKELAKLKKTFQEFTVVDEE
jgi:hypothetical protein